MHLNTLKPAEGSKKKTKRVARGIGSGFGKTAGRGHKGQKSRSGGFHKLGFEGGQMPLQRRLPKVGFASRKKGDTAELHLYQLAGRKEKVYDVEKLKALGLVAKSAKSVKLIKSGEIKRAIKLSGIRITAGARVAVEKAGGSVAE